MKTYPRQLTSRNGVKRWQGRSGRTYDTFDEAKAEPDSDVFDNESGAAQNPIATKPEKRISWGSAIFQTTLAGGLIFAILNGIASGEVNFDSTWMWIGLSVGLFFFAGIFFQGVSEFWAIGTGQRDQVKPEAMSDWWNAHVGCGLLIVAASVTACIAAYAALASAFEGVGKGTAMIVVLLFAILLAIVGRSSNQR